MPSDSGMKGLDTGDGQMSSLRPKMVLNGRQIAFTYGDTILEAAAAVGVSIPSLCEWRVLGHYGICGMCVVKVKGAEDLLPACSTRAEDRMEVQTETEGVVASRKETLSKILSSHRNDCLTCESNGSCRLQDLAYQYSVRLEEQAVMGHFPEAPESPFISRDYSKCIKCGACVAACNAVQGHKAIAYPAGEWSERSSLDDWFPIHDEQKCVDCGQCVEACPVGALTEKKAERLGRSWETKKVRTTCPYCGVGCQQLLHVKGDRVTKVTAVSDGKPNQGRLCVKGRFAYDFLYSEDRLTTPLIKENGAFRQASWDEALDLVATRFSEIIRKHGPDAIAGVSCARALNEDSYNMQKLFRSVIGTNNIDHCART